MRIFDYRLYQFRNIDSQFVECSPTMNGFWGNNGQGKTNFLEALHLCLRGQSFRPYSKRKDALAHNKKEMSVKVSLEDDFGYQHVCEMRYQKERFSYYLNEKKVAAKVLKEKFPIAVFCPDDHELIRGKTEIRRDYLDSLYSDVCPGYSECLESYQKALKHRNMELRKIKESKNFQFDLSSSIWNKTLAQKAWELRELRHELQALFMHYFNESKETMLESYDKELNFQFLNDLELKGLNVDCDKEKFVDFYLKLLEETQMVDIATGWTHRGPHRDDFKLLYRNQEARTHCSQGQSRVFAFLLRWIYVSWVKSSRKEQPIFIIDDLSSELDALHRDQLMTFIERISAQVFISGTQAKVIENHQFENSLHHLISEGKIAHLEMKRSHSNVAISE